MTSLDKMNLKDLKFCPYNVLELPPMTNDDKKIKSHFRKLAFKFHPDRNQSEGARDKFEIIKLASEILLSHSLKSAYDVYLQAKIE